MGKVKCLGVLLFILSMGIYLQAHEGHEALATFSFASWLEGVGRFHLLFLHFPIALIVMTVTAEWLGIWFANPLFNQAARFMILAAAIFAPITALLGLAFGYGQNYTGISLDLYVWHRNFGLLTAGLAILTAILKERYIREYTTSLAAYYLCLFLLFLSVSLAGAFGGSLTFGLDIW